MLKIINGLMVDDTAGTTDLLGGSASEALAAPPASSGPTTDGLNMVTYMTALNPDRSFATSGGTGTNGNTFFDYFSSPQAVTARSWGSGATIYYSFDPASNWSLAEKNAYIQGMTQWQYVSNINFAIADSTHASAFSFVRDTTNNASEADNLDTTPVNGTNNVPATLNNAVIKIGTVAGASWQFIDSYSASGGSGPGTVLHEIFHGIGMGHSGPYNGNSAVIQRYTTNSQKYSMMSYISQNTTAANAGTGSSIPATMSDPNSINYTSWNYTDSNNAAQTGAPTTPQQYDILAAQRLYGAPTKSILTGGQTFGFNSNVTYTAFDGTTANLGSFDFTVNAKPVLTLYDSGINNTLDLSGFTADVTETVDLIAGDFSSVAGLVNNVAIAFATRIDTAKGGGGHTNFVANANGDTIVGGSDAVVANTANTVTLAGNRSAYTLLKNGQGVVTAQTGSVTNTLTNIQTLQFADQSVATSSIVACFMAGTRIDTAAGEVVVERLAVGDLVRTASGGLRPVRWIGQRKLRCDRHPQPQDVYPVRIEAGAFGPAEPRRDLWLSPDHAVFREGVLIPIRQLVNATSVAQVPCAEVRYFHVELDMHDVLFAEGLAAESYLDTGNRSAFVNAGVTVSMQPVFARGNSGAETCVKLCMSGNEVQAVRTDLLARAELLGHPRFTRTDAAAPQSGIRAV